MIMGTYDIIEHNGHDYQIKCYDCTMTTYKQGSIVPSIDDEETYILLFKEGGYMVVSDNMITEVHDDNYFGIPVFNKYGERYN